MCAPSYRCPVCLHSSFSSVTALWQGLMSGASRRLSCPVCQEVLLGLDKLTLHLYSHLPAGNTDTTSSDTNLNPSVPSDIIKESQSRKVICDNKDIDKDLEMTSPSDSQQRDDTTYKIENIIRNESSSLTNNDTEINTNTINKLNAEIDEQDKISCKIISSVPFISPAHQSFNNKVSTCNFNLVDNCQLQVGANILDEHIPSCQTNGTTFQLSLEHLNVDNQLSENIKSSDADMTTLTSDSQVCDDPTSQASNKPHISEIICKDDDQVLCPQTGSHSNVWQGK